MDALACYLPRHRTNPNEAASVSAIKEHGRASAWPFAHLAEALNVMKPDAVLESLVRMSEMSGDHGSLKKVEQIGNKLQQGVSMLNVARGRESLQQSPKSSLEDKIHGLPGNNTTNMDMEVVTRIVNPNTSCNKIFNAHFDVYSAMEQVALLTTEKQLTFDRRSPTSSTMWKNQDMSSYELLEDAWEYSFARHNRRRTVSSRPLSKHKSYTPSFIVIDSCQSSTASKVTVKRLPLRGFQVQVKVTLKDASNSKKDVFKNREKNENTTVPGKCGVRSAQVLKQLFCGGIAGVISRSVVAPLDLIKTYLITSHGVRGSHKSALVICKEIIDSSGWQGLFRGNVVNCIRVAPNKAIELCVFETVRRELNKEGHPLKNAAATIAGGAAGMAGTLATYPLELIRTRLSVQPELYTGALQTFAKIFREEGFMAFYSGLAPSLVGVFPYAATNYFVYDGLRTMYRSSTGRHQVPTIPTLAFGAVAAAASSTVTYPLEVARRQLQLSLGNAGNRSSVGIILNIYKHEGFLALYRGLGTTWLKLIPAAGISFVCYEAARLALSIDDASILVKAKTVSSATKEENICLTPKQKTK